MSLRLANVCTGTPASAHTAANTARLKASVQYFWLAASFTTRPPLRRQRLAASYLPAWLGCTACALSQLTSIDLAMAW